MSKIGVGYIRASKARDEMVSPRFSRLLLRPWLRVRESRFSSGFRDLDKTGRTFEKRAVKEIVVGVEDGIWETVILWKWSRWGRDASQSGMYVDAVDASGGQVRAAAEDIDVSTAIGKFHRGQMFLMAEFESNQKSEQWKEAHDLRRQSGCLTPQTLVSATRMSEARATS